MQIQKGAEEVLSIRKVTKSDYTLTNKNGDIREVSLEIFTDNDERGGYDGDETIYCDGEEITDWDEFIFEFAGEEEDAQVLLETLKDAIKI